jgi:hypothetical protein
MVLRVEDAGRKNGKSLRQFNDSPDVGAQRWESVTVDASETGLPGRPKQSRVGKTRQRRCATQEDKGEQPGLVRGGNETFLL